MPEEPVIIDEDPREDTYAMTDPVMATIDLPPRATTNGWGNLSFLYRRHRFRRH